MYENGDMFFLQGLESENLSSLMPKIIKQDTVHSDSSVLSFGGKPISMNTFFVLYTKSYIRDGFL